MKAVFPSESESSRYTLIEIRSKSRRHCQTKKIMRGEHSSNFLRLILIENPNGILVFAIYDGRIQRLTDVKIIVLQYSNVAL